MITYQIAAIALATALAALASLFLVLAGPAVAPAPPRPGVFADLAEPLLTAGAPGAVPAGTEYSTPPGD